MKRTRGCGGLQAKHESAVHAGTKEGKQHLELCFQEHHKGVSGSDYFPLLGASWTATEMLCLVLDSQYKKDGELVLDQWKPPGQSGLDHLMQDLGWFCLEMRWLWEHLIAACWCLEYLSRTLSAAIAL